MKETIHQYTKGLADRHFDDDTESCLALLEAMTTILAAGKPLQFTPQDGVRRQAYIHWMNQLIMGLNHHFSTSVGSLSEMIETLQTEINLRRNELDTNKKAISELKEEAEVLERINNLMTLRKEVQEIVNNATPCYETLKTCGSRIQEQREIFDQLAEQIAEGLAQMKQLLADELSEHEILLQELEYKLSASET